jgi:hypothetical protein
MSIIYFPRKLCTKEIYLKTLICANLSFFLNALKFFLKVGNNVYGASICKEGSWLLLNIPEKCEFKIVPKTAKWIWKAETEKTFGKKNPSFFWAESS